MLLRGANGVAYSSLPDNAIDTTSFVHSLDTNLELVEIVQGIEYTEDIDTVLLPGSG
jgi:pyruvate carboxylase